jgi:hypothetical protein
MRFIVIPEFSESEVRKAWKTHDRALRARTLRSTNLGRHGTYRKKAGSKMHPKAQTQRGNISALGKLLKAGMFKQARASNVRSHAHGKLAMAGQLRRHGTYYGRKTARKILTKMKRSRKAYSKVVGKLP